jgi:hypothetical protein
MGLLVPGLGSRTRKIDAFISRRVMDELGRTGGRGQASGAGLLPETQMNTTISGQQNLPAIARIVAAKL